MRTRLVLALCRQAAALVAVVTAFPAQSVELRGDPGANTATDIVITRDQVEVALRLDNDASESADLTLNVRPVRVSGARPCVEAAGCTLALYRRDPAGEQKLDFGKDHKMLIATLGSQPLLLKGSVPGIGRYVVDVAIGQSRQPSALKSVVIRRDLRELPQNTLTLGPTALLPMAYDGSTPAIPIRLAATQDGVQLDRLAASLLAADATASYTEPVDWPNPHLICPSATGQGGQGRIDAAPGANLSCAVRLPRWILPGAYRVRVEALGPGLKTVEASTDARVRGPAWAAFLALLAGSLAGAWLAGWSRDGRDRLLLAIEAQEVREQYIDVEKRAAAGATQAKALIAQRYGELASIVEQLRNGTSPTTHADKVERLRDLLPLVARFASLEQQFPYPAGDKPLYDAAIKALGEILPDLAVSGKSLDTLEQKLRAPAPGQRVNPNPNQPTGVFLFSWKHGIAANALRNLLNRNDKILAAVSLVVAILIGMATLWSANPTWGSLSDVLVAILTGVAITAGGAISLQQLAQNYQLGTLARPR